MVQVGTWTAALLLVGCGRWGFDGRIDAGADAAPAASDPPEACDPMAPFGLPVVIPELSDPGEADGTLRLLPDELTGYFWSRRGGGDQSRIYYAMRPDLRSPFEIQVVTGLDPTGNTLDPTLSTQGETVLVYRRNSPGDDLWIATAVTATEFTSPTAISNLNSTSNDSQPFLRHGSDELIYFSARTGGGDLYQATRTGPTTFAAPQRIIEVATAAEEGDPVVSADGLALYFRSLRVGTPLAGHNVYGATRALPTDPWGTPVLLPNINSNGDDGPSSVSADGCRLYISSDRLGTNDVFVATRGT